MLETKGGRIALLIFMAAVLIYTVINYAKGETNIMLLGLAVFIAVTTGSKIVQSLIEDFKNSRK